MSKIKPKTRHQHVARLSQYGNKLTDFIGPGKEFDVSEVPTMRSAIQKGILIKEKLMIEDGVVKTQINPGMIARKVAPLVIAQWTRANVKFVPPVTFKEHSLVRKIEKFWIRVENVAWGRSNKKETENVTALLDKLLDITTCSHLIQLCHEVGSVCPGKLKCKTKAHISCSCLLSTKVPVMELRWLYFQRKKIGEKSKMMMGNNDKKESARQNKALQRNLAEEEADLKTQKKQAEKEKLEQEKIDEERKLQEQDKVDVEGNTIEMEAEEEYLLPLEVAKKEQKELIDLVDWLLEEKLGKLAPLVTRYLDRKAARRNMMPVPNTALCSLRYGVSSVAAAAI